MAESNLVNKVILNGETVLDLSSDLVQPNYVMTGVTFHDRTGQKQVGTLEPFGASIYLGEIQITRL